MSGASRRQLQHAADVGLVDLLGGGDLPDGRVLAVLSISRQRNARVVHH